MEDLDVPIVDSGIGGPGSLARFHGLDLGGNLLELYPEIDHVGWDGVARQYPAIQEIDFEAYELERKRWPCKSGNGTPPVEFEQTITICGPNDMSQWDAELRSATLRESAASAGRGGLCRSSAS
ncbi:MULTISPECIES: hypothetical protein [Nocardia]|uniref:hypothetical protein n=1 Tax=Nocardia abscessus TaxID=120957 RepID=UPI002458533E|nr:hypothetical protein [Nocardia abscessus]